jgi:hypothetical protein
MKSANNTIPPGAGQSSDSALELDVTYLPQGGSPNATHAAGLGGWQLMLSAYSKNKDAAAKLIKYMVSCDTQKEHAFQGFYKRDRRTGKVIGLPPQLYMHAQIKRPSATRRAPGSARTFNP